MIEILSYQFLTKITEEVTSVSLWMKLLMCPSWNSSVSVVSVSYLNKKLKSAYTAQPQTFYGSFTKPLQFSGIQAKSRKHIKCGQDLWSPTRWNIALEHAI